MSPTIGPCKLPKGYWWLCGDGYSRKLLPAGWKGTCTIGYLTSQDTVFNQSEIPSGMLRTPWRRIREVENPLVTRGTRYHSFIRWLIPSLSVSELEKAIVNLSATTEALEKTTIDAIEALQQEVQSLANVAGQNRMALDLLTWKEGGLCAVINQSCCSYANQSGRIEKDLENLIAKTQILHQTAQDDTTFGFSDFWEKLTSWLPNLAWLKQLFILLVAILVRNFSCVLARCFMCLWVREV
ncbi:LOW QUALITY PROTEIN: syncytin-2-like [Numenius arquata]|uniref:LOW QUALITY PROTEIN: syncytin-2-like n=1 Tax=Numenius arquata TaxID=31919 RepID=UPI003D305226